MSVLKATLLENKDITAEMIMEDLWLTMDQLGETGTMKELPTVMQELGKQYTLLLTKFPFLHGAFNSAMVFDLFSSTKIPGTEERAFNVVKNGESTYLEVFKKKESSEDVAIEPLIKSAIDIVFDKNFIQAVSVTEIVMSLMVSKKVSVSDSRLIQSLSDKWVTDSVRKYMVENYVPVFGGYMPKDSDDIRDGEVEAVRAMYLSLISDYDIASKFEIFTNILLGKVSDFEEFNNTESSRYDYSWLPTGPSLKILVRRIYKTAFSAVKGIISSGDLQKVDMEVVRIFTLSQDRVLGSTDPVATKDFSDKVKMIEDVCIEVKQEYADRGAALSSEIGGTTYFFYTEFIEFDIAVAADAIMDQLKEVIVKSVDYLIDRCGYVPSLMKLNTITKAYTNMPIDKYMLTEYAKENLQMDYNGLYKKDHEFILDSKEVLSVIQYNY